MYLVFFYFFLEFKSTDNIEKLEEVSKEALKQIEEKKYDVSLKQNGIKEITYFLKNIYIIKKELTNSK